MQKEIWIFGIGLYESLYMGLQVGEIVMGFLEKIDLDGGIGIVVIEKK